MPHSCRSNDLRKSCRAFCVSGCSDYNIIDKPFHAAQSADILFDSPKSTSCPLWPSRSRYRRLSFCPVRSKSRTRPSRWSGLARQNAPSFRPNQRSSRGGLSSLHLARQSLWTRTPNHRRKRRRRAAESSQGRSVASCWYEVSSTAHWTLGFNYIGWPYDVISILAVTYSCQGCAEESKSSSKGSRSSFLNNLLVLEYFPEHNRNSSSIERAPQYSYSDVYRRPTPSNKVA